jgi:hypothetical protein
MQPQLTSLLSVAFVPTVVKSEKRNKEGTEDRRGSQRNP